MKIFIISSNIICPGNDKTLYVSLYDLKLTWVGSF
jgi:hypothetical protein